MWGHFCAVACFVANSQACVAALGAIKSGHRPVDFYLLVANALMPPLASGHTIHCMHADLFVGCASSMFQLFYVHQQIQLHPGVAMLQIFLLFGGGCCVWLPFDLVGLSSCQVA